MRLYYCNVLQVVTTERETFVWWEDHTAGRVEWRYTCLEYGGLLLMIQPTILMLRLFVDSLDMTLDVSSISIAERLPNIGNVILCVFLNNNYVIIHVM